MARSGSRLPAYVLLGTLALSLVILVGAGPQAYFRCGLINGCDGPRPWLAYVLESSLGYEGGIEAAHVVDITPFVVALIVAASVLILRSRSGSGDAADDALAALNRCDGCKTTFRNFDYLTKVEGRGYLCENCRRALETPQP